MRAVAAPGRRAWGGIGLVTAAALAVLGGRLIVSPGIPWHEQPVQSSLIRTVTVAQPVTSLTVHSYGAPVRVTAGPRVRVIEQISYDKQAGGPPAVTVSVSDGQLTLAEPVCGDDPGCTVGFAVTVPPTVTATVETAGGDAVLSGIAGADVTSEGGAVRADQIHGPLTVASGGGPVLVDGTAGPLRADSDGGNVTAAHVAASTATVNTGGGATWVAFSVVPNRVTVSSDGGAATLIVPGGPYALNADTDGGSEQFRIATDPAAHRSITVTTGGGPLLIKPGRG